MNDYKILKTLLLFELEVAILSFVAPLLFGYENITKQGQVFFDAGVSTCPATYHMVTYGLVIGLVGFAIYYFFFNKLLKTSRPWLLFLFHLLAIVSAAGSLFFLLCGF